MPCLQIQPMKCLEQDNSLSGWPDFSKHTTGAVELNMTSSLLIWQLNWQETQIMQQYHRGHRYT